MVGADTQLPVDAVLHCVEAVENILRLHKKGYNFKAIKRTTGVSEFWIGKVVGRNAVVQI